MTISQKTAWAQRVIFGALVIAWVILFSITQSTVNKKLKVLFQLVEMKTGIYKGGALGRTSYRPNRIRRYEN